SPGPVAGARGGRAGQRRRAIAPGMDTWADRRGRASPLRLRRRGAGICQIRRDVRDARYERGAEGSVLPRPIRPLSPAAGSVPKGGTGGEGPRLRAEAAGGGSARLAQSTPTSPDREKGPARRVGDGYGICQARRKG